MARDELTSVKTSFLAIIYLLCTFLAFACCSEVFAQTTRAKAKSIPVNNPSQLIAIQQPVKQKKKTTTLNGFCYPYKKKDTAGDVRTKKGRQVFTPWGQKANQIKKKARAKGKRGKSNKKLLKQAALYKKAAKLGNAQCKNTTNPDNPTQNLFTRYTGAFGRGQARTLFNRFGYGAKEGELNLAVAEGMDATIARLTNFNEPYRLVERTKDLRCDGVINVLDPDGGEVCKGAEINDVDFNGVRYDIIYRAIESPFWTQMWTFYHEMGTASLEVLDSDERHAAPEYVDLLRRHSKNGNYKQFLIDLYTDSLMLKYLDARLSTKYKPNENYARELMELFSLGVFSHETGQENYTDADVLTVSKVLTGWSSRSIEIFEDYYVELPIFVPHLKDYDIHTIFRGTPYERGVRDNHDVIDAITARPQFSEHLGYRILTKFVKPNPTVGEIKAMAALLRKHENNTTNAIKELMTLKILYAPENQNNLFKTPFEYVMSLVRVLGLKPNFYVLDDVIQKMGQKMTEPPSVFAWDYPALVREAYVVPRMNGIMRIFSDYTFQQNNDNDWDRFLHNEITSKEVIRKLANIIGVPLNDEQLENYNQFMNYNLRSDGSLDPRLFDPRPESDYIWRDKTAGIASMLAWTHPAQTK